jgi:hypothetical protein
MQSMLLGMSSHPFASFIVINLSVSFSLGTHRYIGMKTLINTFTTQPYALEHGIFSNTKILIRVIRQNVIYDHSHCGQYLLICTKSNKTGNIPPASEKNGV